MNAKRDAETGRWLCGVAFFVVASASAGPYGPFAPDEQYTAKLDRCGSVQEVAQDHPPIGTVELFRTGSGRRLKILMAGTSSLEAAVFTSGQKSSSARIPFELVMPFDIRHEDAICADLNEDGQVDFVVALSYHGNSLGAWSYRRLIVLSTGEEYRFWQVETMNPSAEDFVSLGKAAPLAMVTTDFFTKRDPKPEQHSYFVYDLWAFKGGEPVLANSLDPRFPKWVWFTFKPNSKPALSLTEEDKRSLRSEPRATEAFPAADASP